MKYWFEVKMILLREKTETVGWYKRHETSTAMLVKKKKKNLLIIQFNSHYAKILDQSDMSIPESCVFINHLSS